MRKPTDSIPHLEEMIKKKKKRKISHIRSKSLKSYFEAIFGWGL